MRETVPPRPSGFPGAFRAFGDGLLAVAQDRVALYSLELHEEKCRLIQTFVWMNAVIFTCMMAVTFASLAMVYLLWESARLTVLGGLTVLFTGLLVAFVIAFRRYLARQPEPFAATLHEFKEDRACIRPED